MRTTKRFSPSVLARFERQGRGLGTFSNYSPWHQVTRGDPASQGRSHLIYWKERLVHLLSDLEWGGQLFGLMLPNLIDSTEQAPLSIDGAPHPLSAYTLKGTWGEFPGTLELSKQLGIKHPRVNGNGTSVLWRLSTDLVLITQDELGSLAMLAIAIKPPSWDVRQRTKDLLRLERAYWQARGVEWLLVTPAVWNKAIFLTLRRTCHWALAELAPAELRDRVVSVARANPFASITALIETIEPLFLTRHEAQCALWQAIWAGQLPIDLRRGWRPQTPLRYISEDEFLAQNPIASRRSAWI